MAEYLDTEHLLSLGKIDPELEAFLNANNIPPVDYSNLSDFKKLIEGRNEAAMAALGETPPEIKKTVLEYPTRDGVKIQANLYQPTSPPKEGSPFIVMYHGGGFCLGAPEGEEQTCRNFVQAFGAVCLSATYRLAPEFPFPIGMDDAWDALKWADSNAKSWGADPSLGFCIGGTSAGGCITAVLAHLARDEEGLSAPLTGQYLAIPAVLPEDEVPEKYKPYFLSYEQNKNAPVLPKAAIDMFMDAYKPDTKDRRHAPFNDPNGHANLPPALFQIDGLDPLRDDGIIYERVLREENGIKTKMFIYPGLPHGHWGFFPFLKSSDKFRREQVEGMGWLLGKTPDFTKVNTGAVAAGV